MNNKLRLVSGLIVAESKLPKKVKIKLLDFIQYKATDVYLKLLLMDGAIVKLDKKAKRIVNERFKVHPISKKLSENTFKAFGNTFIILTK